MIATKKKDEVVTLSAAAHMLGLTYHATLKLVYIDELKGRSEHKTDGGNARWFVYLDSLEDYIDRQPSMPKRRKP
jgi:hypothetical protein